MRGKELEFHIAARPRLSLPPGVITALALFYGVLGVWKEAYIRCRDHRLLYVLLTVLDIDRRLIRHR